MTKIAAPTGALRAHLKLAEKAAWAREYYRNAPDDGHETRQMLRHAGRRHARQAGSRRLADNKPFLDDVRHFRKEFEGVQRVAAKARGLVVDRRLKTGFGPKLVKAHA